MVDVERGVVAVPIPQGPEMSGQDVADVLGFLGRWLRKLELQGFVERKENSLFDLVAVCLGYIRWLKDDARQSSKTEVAKLKEAEQLRKLQLENAKTAGELADMETVETTFAEMFLKLRNHLSAVPAGITRDLALRADLEARHERAFAECHKDFEALIESLGKGATSLPNDDEEADA